MSRWLCAIEGCMTGFEDVESLLAHQRDDHDSHDCAICGQTVPAGLFAIRHAFHEHTRAEYVRHYDADSEDIRWREQVLAAVEDSLDAAAGD